MKHLLRRPLQSDGHGSGMSAEEYTDYAAAGLPGLDGLAHLVAPQIKSTDGRRMVLVDGKITAYRGDALANPNQYIINVPGTLEYIRQPLYSRQSYPAAGATQLTFFQTQVGSANTIQSTNMQLQGQIAAPQMFLIDGIGITYFPGTTTSPPVLLRADAATGAMNDFYTVMKKGVVTLHVGNKSYLTYGPMMNLPARAHMDGNQAVTSATTAAASLQTIMQVPFSTGPVYKTVPYLLEASQNFNITISFPDGVVPIPSGDALAEIQVDLYGTLYRAAQ